MKTFEDQVRSVIESNATPAYDKEQALRLYVEQSEMDALVKGDMDRYQVALEATGGAFGDIEPISRFHEAYQDEVDLAYAAAVVGLAPKAFLEKIRANIGLQNIGLLVLDSENGSIKRDTWTSNFVAMIYALDFPEAEVDSPSQPDLLPGGAVHIPDPHLRATIAEVVGKNLNAPINVEEMERLTKLEVPDAGIGDLTGLQFATNLRELDVSNNQISDLSPIAGLTTLRRLRFAKNPISDISPLRGLTNLTNLTLHHTLVSDPSPIAGLVNLKGLDFNITPVSDISVVKGLINLEFLAIPDANISDLSPIAGLTNLNRFFSWGNPLTDLSILAGLTKLRQLDICGAKLSDLTPLASLRGLKELYLAGNGISDISPLARLTGVTRLNLSDNEISDISSLAGLTSLTWLGIEHNEIADFSPLDGLRENTKIAWHANPGFPKGGPKIEGPWLWGLLPNTETE